MKVMCDCDFLFEIGKTRACLLLKEESPVDKEIVGKGRNSW